MTSQTLRLETSTGTLQLDAANSRLVSLRHRAAPDQELILPGEHDPVFVIQYLDAGRRFRQISSTQAQTIDVYADDSGSVTGHFRQVSGLDIDITVTVRAAGDQPLSYWSLALRNQTGLLITDIQFPFVIAPYRLPGKPGSESLLWPLGAGVLLNSPKPQDLEPDNPHTWQMRPENSDSLHYPGFTTAQFLAYFNDRAGLYLACQDSSGLIKQIKPVHHEPGIRLGMAHVGDWPQNGERQLEYHVVLGAFTGDWYAAAELYRSWTLKQPWARTPLTARKDVPDWLLDSPPHIILRMQGELDLGPALPNTQFIPYAKTIPLLETIAKRMAAPVTPVIMSWERPGPWIYPDCFPPAGGENALRDFTALARDRGWHVGTFCNGTRWVVGHYWNDYDGEDYFAEHQGVQSVSRTHLGELWKEHWDATWRPSYACCVGAPLTREIAIEFVRKIIELGLDWIQFFDQNVGCSTFPCFAADHEHPPAPGRWMTEHMRHLIHAFHGLAADERTRSADNRQIVFSVEGPVNEYFLSDFQICDIRVLPPNHEAYHPIWKGSVPLYHFLYHEFVLIQGGFGHGADPHHLAIRNAFNLIVGEIPGAVMTGDGRLLNVDSPGINWAPWEPQVGDNDEALTMLASATALRRGPGKDFLVYGRMLSPAPINSIQLMRWQYEGRDHQVPAIFHAAWQSPDQRFGLVLANWTKEWQDVAVSDARLGTNGVWHLATRRVESKSYDNTDESLALRLPPLSCALLEAH
jgi:hypothetical protein